MDQETTYFMDAVLAWNASYPPACAETGILNTYSPGEYYGAKGRNYDNIKRVMCNYPSSSDILTYTFDTSDNGVTYWQGNYAFVEFWMKASKEVINPICFRVENQKPAPNGGWICTYPITYASTDWIKYSIDVRGGGSKYNAASFDKLDNYGLQPASYDTYHLFFAHFALRKTYSVCPFSVGFTTTTNTWGEFSTYKW